ncbi:alpha/beta hydrolase [Paenalcaligenes niemegkensis]|uniref:alpha/beta hydrolase n=1 Tax=Paenalcaligenes niemegkensis TaxID=2895469 RepID=UPI001EE7FCED|nr:alpha/beta hydrolase [Paenalcaligenes niemegkensis]MCQ9616368.1 alpha/beta hydrolase [Paenalcaligenes niemegkensis]
MTPEQFTLIAKLVQLPESLESECAAQLIDKQSPVLNQPASDELTLWLHKLHELDQALRYAYISHRPSEFRITVGHRDTHRMPGAIKLKVGQTVRLVAHSTERWIPVRIVTLASRPTDYHQGIITEQLVKRSIFQVGNRVLFSDDQVDIEPPRAARRRKT